jgi:putative transposase
VYSDNALICRAACFELTGKTVSLKEVQQARNHESKIQRQQLKALLAVAEKYAPVIKFPERMKEQVDPVAVQAVEYPKFKIKRFACDD